MTILVLVFLIILSGIFVMSEMAIVSARKVRLQQWSDSGRKSACRALALANKPANFLSTIQIGITVIAILSGAIGEAAFTGLLTESLSEVPWLEPYANQLAFWIPVTGLAFFSIIFGELVPKRLALQIPEAVARAKLSEILLNDFNFKVTTFFYLLKLLYGIPDIDVLSQPTRL